VAYRYQQCHCLVALSNKMSVLNSHVQDSHSVISNKPRLHTKKKHIRTITPFWTSTKLILIKCTELRMHLFISGNELHSAFPNTEVAFRIYLCLMVSNCTEERSFSKMRRIRCPRSSTVQEKLSMLCLTSMEIRTWRQSSTISQKKQHHQISAADIFSKSTHWQSEETRSLQYDRC